MANTSSIQNQTPRPEITFYALGERLPRGTFKGDDIVEIIHATLRKMSCKFVPTTYEAAKSYLDQELLKEKGQRNILREMSMLIVTNVPGDQDLAFKADAANLLIAFRAGDVLFYPTVALPPNSFGTHENPYSNLLLDRKTSTPGRATVLMTYFTRDEDNVNYDADADVTEKTQLGHSPFA